MSDRLLVGLTGDPGSGKSASAAYLVKAHEFAELSGRAYLEQLAAEYGTVLHHRTDYRNFQRKMRLERSKSFVVDAMLEMPGDRILFDGIRNKFDVEKLQEQKIGGLVIAFACPVEIRFERTKGSAERYQDTLNDFIAAEAAEYEDPDPYGLHTHWAMDHADYIIDNSSRPLEEVQRILDGIVSAHS